jgi:3-oxoadipate enol-lactonase
MTPRTTHATMASTATAPDRYLTCGAVRLRYRDEGSGPALLLVHGWTLDLHMWDPQVAALRDSFRLVRLDRRGHGLSSGIATAHQDAADLATLCQQLQLNHVALLGMSQGARAVVEFAAAAGEQVRALILDGAPDLTRLHAPEEVPIRHFRALMRRGDRDAFRLEWLTHPLMQLRSHDRRMHELLAEMVARYQGADLLGSTDIESTTPTPPDLQRIRQPTLVISGADDLPSRALAARHLVTLLPAAEAAVIANAAHLPNLDNPSRYNELCRSFLLRQFSGRSRDD